jgi:hypothetical protein
MTDNKSTLTKFEVEFTETFIYSKFGDSFSVKRVK